MKRCLFAIGAVWAVSFFLSPPLWADEVSDGKEIFRVKCYLCHTANDPEDSCAARSSDAKPFRGNRNFSLVQNRFGPDLCGIVGAPAGRRIADGFIYSPGFQERMKDIVWTPENLDSWLTITWEFIPNTWMFLRIPDTAERGKIIAYLKTLK